MKVVLVAVVITALACSTGFMAYKHFSSQAALELGLKAAAAGQPVRWVC